MTDERSKVLWANVIGHVHPTLARILGYDPDHLKISDEPGDCIFGAASVPEKLTEEAIRTFAEDLRISLMGLNRIKANVIMEEVYWFRAIGDDENEMNEEFIRELCKFKAQVESWADFETDLADLAKDLKDEVAEALTNLVASRDYDDGVSEPCDATREFIISCPSCDHAEHRFITEEHVLGDKVRHYQCGSCPTKFTVVYGKASPVEVELDKVPLEDGEFDENASDKENIEMLIQHFADCLHHQPTFEIITWSDFIDGAEGQCFPKGFVDSYKDDLRHGWVAVTLEYIGSKRSEFSDDSIFTL